MVDWAQNTNMRVAEIGLYCHDHDHAGWISRLLLLQLIFALKLIQSVQSEAREEEVAANPDRTKAHRVSVALAVRR